MAELVQGKAMSTMVEDWPYRLIDMAGAKDSELYRVDRDPGQKRDLSAEETAVRDRLERLSGAHKRAAAERRRPEMAVPREGEVRRQLEALGYVDPDDV
jgi:hypothetical protein